MGEAIGDEALCKTKAFIRGAPAARRDDHAVATGEGGANGARVVRRPPRRAVPLDVAHRARRGAGPGATGPGRCGPAITKPTPGRRLLCNSQFTIYG